MEFRDTPDVVYRAVKNTSLQPSIISIIGYGTAIVSMLNQAIQRSLFALLRDRRASKIS